MRRKFLGRGIEMGLFALAGTCQANGSTLPAMHYTSDLEGRIQELLSAYAANRSAQVVAMLDTKGWVVFGSDVAEIVRSNSALLEMMRADFALWKTATFANIRDLNIQTDGALASAMFHVDFSAGGRPPIPVRFCTTWRQIQGTWMLSQCANTVPTTHSSAAELLHR
jgi:ketosteroid isomerase-like protein